MLEKLTQLYGRSRAREIHQKIQRLIELHGENKPAEGQKPPSRASFSAVGTKNAELPDAGRFSEKDLLLITYGDQIQSAEYTPLQTLHRFLRQRLLPVFSGVHLLPFYPSSSDEGFSVTDYRQVNPALGSWADIHLISREFKLMFDGVFNHISVQSRWFQRFLAGDQEFRDYFIIVAPSADTSQVVRPRTSPLLTPFTTDEGVKHIWTTFSADQADLNFANPDVLLKMSELVLFYVENGASLIRLDAIPFLWKTPGTKCVHLPQTHMIVQLWHELLDQTAPAVQLVTECNVPEHENLPYLGNGFNEAHMIYQFPLPPLLLDAFYSGNAEHLTNWALSLRTPSAQTAFFNLTASHDGIGLRPAEGLLNNGEIRNLIEQTRTRGGEVLFRTQTDGEKIPYELNITLYDALRDPALSLDHPLNICRFLTAQSIGLSLAGVPGIYFHNLLGTLNDQEGFRNTGETRVINRRKFSERELELLLSRPSTRERKIFDAMLHRLCIRTHEKAFHPAGIQRVIDTAPEIFALLRLSPDKNEPILALHNLSGQTLRTVLDLRSMELHGYSRALELIGGTRHSCSGNKLDVNIPPYETLWLKFGQN